MTYQTLIRNHKNSLTHQAGISLMLSILVLAAITAISFSLTTIVFIELRSSTDVIKSEPALYATLGVTEEALFQYKRYVNDRDGTPLSTALFDVPSCSVAGVTGNVTATHGICNIGNVAITLPKDSHNRSQPLSEDDPVHLETLYTGNHNTTVIPLYQLNDFTLQYGLIRMQRVPTGNPGLVTYQIREISSDTSTADTFYGPWNLNDNDPTPGDFHDFRPGYEYELILTNNSSYNVQVSIASYDTDQTTPKGLPFVGKKVLQVVAQNGGLNRTYKVFIPVP